MSHWTHFVTEADIAQSATPEQWEVEEAWEAERVALCNANNDGEYLEALEREARRAEHEGLMVCGDDEWAWR